MEDSKAETAELFYGLRPDSKKAASRCRPASAISNAKETTKCTVLDHRVDTKSTITCRPASGISNPKETTKCTFLDPVDAKSTITSTSAESMKSELLSKIASLEGSLLAEIHESRVREEKLRNRLAKSRVVAKELQAKLSTYDQAERGHGYVSDKAPEQAKSAPLIPSRANWVPPEVSCCADLKELARNQVIRSVQDISPPFTVDLEVYSYGGYIPWPRVLEWLEDHPEVVDTIGLNLHALRTI